MARLFWSIRRALERDDGQTMVEYELLILLVAVACIVLIIFLGETIRDTFVRIGVEIPS